MAGGTPANPAQLARKYEKEPVGSLSSSVRPGDPGQPCPASLGTVGEYSSPVQDIRGRTVLLTGASTGLGPHIARRLHGAGAKFVLSARNEEALNRLAQELGESRVIVADLSRAGEAERLAEGAGAVDVLVSHAGIP